MKNKTKIKITISITFLSLSALVLIFGCSIAPYPTGDISKNPASVRMKFKSILDVKNLPLDMELLKYSPDQNGVTFEIKGLKPASIQIELDSGQTFSVKYHHCLLHPAPLVVVPVEFPNGRKYMAYLDTGCELPFLLTSDIVIKNKLAIYPVTAFSLIQGLCRIPVLNIGPAKIKDVVGFYCEQQWQLRVFNIPLYNQPSIILGREFIKSFDYVMFDNVNHEAVFSEDGVFKPDNPHIWSSYSFYEDPNRDNTIMVKMPISGKVFDIAFDSCGDKPGLRLSPTDWDVISKDLTFKNLCESKYLSWQSGRLSFQKATVSELTVGEKKIKNNDVLIFHNPEELSVISLGYFQDTVVVLDYVNNLMWIKKT